MLVEGIFVSTVMWIFLEAHRYERIRHCQKREDKSKLHTGRELCVVWTKNWIFLHGKGTNFITPQEDMATTKNQDELTLLLPLINQLTSIEVIACRPAVRQLPRYW